MNRDPFNTASAEVRRALEKVAKWRQVFAAWQLGSRNGENPETEALRDHREGSILMRAEVNALVTLLVRQGVFTWEEWQTRLSEEAARLDAAFESKFPGISTTVDSIVYDPVLAVQTMADWLP